VQPQSASAPHRTLPFQPVSSHLVPSTLHVQRGPSASDGISKMPSLHVSTARSNPHVSAEHWLVVGASGCLSAGLAWGTAEGAGGGGSGG
jgi:hypothetical protein